MTSDVVLSLDGAQAPPRSNGELVFTEPWQSTYFGMVLGLCEAGRLDFEDFRQALIGRIGAWESTGQSSDSFSYWEHWAGALEDVLTASSLLLPTEIDRRAQQLVDSWSHNHDDSGDHGHAH